MINELANWATLVQTLPVLAGVGILYHHLLCQEPGCKRLGHPLRRHRCLKHEPKERKV